MDKEKAKQILESWMLQSKRTEERIGYVEGWFFKEDEEAFNMAIEALQEPTEKTWWIPCSESLPEDRRDVLVYLSSRRMTIACYNDHKLPFSDKTIGWGFKPLQGKIDFENEFVMAWMPLPKPYESEDE